MRFTMRAMLFLLAVAVLSLTVAQFPSAEEPRPVAKTTAPQKTSTPEQTRIFEIRYRPTAEESCTVRHAYEGNTPHGEWIWKDAAGKVLQTARFERGEVVDWNGQAVERELEEWFSRNHIPEKCRLGLRARVGNVKWWYEDSIGQFGVEEVPFHDNSQIFEMFLGGYHDWDRVREMEGRAKQRPAESVAIFFLREALLKNHTLGARFSIPRQIPICTTEMNWRDPTGVSAVKFATDSAAAAEWVNMMQDEVPGDELDRKYLRSFFVGTSIQIDTSEFPKSRLPDLATPRTVPWGFDQLPSPRPFTKPHRRCDLLGLFLLQHKWSCEQRGNVLILHPYPVEQVSTDATP